MTKPLPDNVRKLRYTGSDRKVPHLEQEIKEFCAPTLIVRMTTAQYKRQDLQVEWLKQAIAAQDQGFNESLDSVSLRLPRAK